MAAASAGAVGLVSLSSSIALGSSVITAGGIPLVASIFGIAGASLTSWNVHRLTEQIQEFLFLQLPDRLIPSETQQGFIDSIEKGLESALDQLTEVIYEPDVLLQNLIHPCTALPPELALSDTQTKDSDDELQSLMDEFEVLSEVSETDSCPKFSEPTNSVKGFSQDSIEPSIDWTPLEYEPDPLEHSGPHKLGETIKTETQTPG